MKVEQLRGSWRTIPFNSFLETDRVAQTPHSARGEMSVDFILSVGRLLFYFEANFKTRWCAF